WSGMGGPPAAERTRSERRTTHVEVPRDLFADAGSIPAGSISITAGRSGFWWSLRPAVFHSLQSPSSTVQRVLWRSDRFRSLQGQSYLCIPEAWSDEIAMGPRM